MYFCTLKKITQCFGSATICMPETRNPQRNYVNTIQTHPDYIGIALR